MKNLFFTISILLLVLSCKAQSPIVPLDTYINEIADNSYVKDTDNELNKFVGTWTFNNGTTSFTITLQKQEQKFNDDYYEDYLIGEYAYSNNGLNIIDTLSELPDENSDDDSSENGLINNVIISQNTNYNIGGRYIVTGPDHSCPDCAENERRIELYFIDPDRKYLSIDLFLRYIVGETNPEKITATIRARSGVVIPVDGFISPRVPYGTYLMEKQ